VVGLERNEWRGSVEARPVLRALCATQAGEVRLADPAHADGTRPVWDRRGQGIAGVAGELLQSGDLVVAMCGDASRRRDGLGLIAGLAPSGRLELAEWGQTVDPAAHILAIDPPAAEEPPGGSGLLVKAWGIPEVQFALSVAEQAGNLRVPLAEVYRALRDAGGFAEGEQLQAILGGRPECLLDIISELGLGTVAPGSCRLDLDAPKADLDASPTYAAAQRRLAQARIALRAEAEWLELPAGERLAGELA
jgi:hypothetical protein